MKAIREETTQLLLYPGKGNERRQKDTLRLAQCLVNGGQRQLPDFIFKTKQIKSLGMYLRFNK